MFPHTRDGVKSDDERIKDERRGLLLQEDMPERAVAVINTSGWWIRRLCFRLTVMVGIREVGDDEGKGVEKVPMTFITSP
jgi:hypothetical protein